MSPTRLITTMIATLPNAHTWARASDKPNDDAERPLAAPVKPDVFLSGSLPEASRVTLIFARDGMTRRFRSEHQCRRRKTHLRAVLSRLDKLWEVGGNAQRKAGLLGLVDMVGHLNG